MDFIKDSLLRLAAWGMNMQPNYDFLRCDSGPYLVWCKNYCWHSLWFNHILMKFVGSLIKKAFKSKTFIASNQLLWKRLVIFWNFWKAHVPSKKIMDESFENSVNSSNWTIAVLLNLSVSKPSPFFSYTSPNMTSFVLTSPLLDNVNH